MIFNLNIRKKLMISVFIPIIGLSVMAIKEIATKKREYDEAVSVQHIVELSVKASELLHEIQQERGMTAAFLGTQGHEFDALLQAQHQQTDSVSLEFQQFVGRFDFTPFGTGLQVQERKIDDELGRVARLRARVTDLSINVDEALDKYGRLNTQLLNMISSAAAQSANDGLNKQILAYYNLLQGKELAGVELAVLSHTFARDRFDGGMLNREITLLSQQNTYFKYFYLLASEDIAALAKNMENQSAMRKVKLMRQLVLQKSTQGDFGVSVRHWFKVATQGIGELKEVGDGVASAIRTQAQEAASTALVQAIRQGIFHFILVTLVVSVSFMIVQKLLLQIASLTTTIKQVAEAGDLSLLVQVVTDDELGQTGRVFNLMIRKFAETMAQVKLSSEQLAAVAEEASVVSVKENRVQTSQQTKTELLVSAVDQVSTSVLEVAHSVNVAAETAQKATEASSEGKAVVAKTVQAIDIMSSMMNEIQDDVSDLAEQCNQVGDILDVIREVTKQTNLLALNAAIEAAHAGEQGRGVAVVADQVRLLAQRTHDSTEEIQQMVQNLQQGALKTQASMAKGYVQSDFAANQARQAGDALEDIFTAVIHITDMSHQIASVTKEQSVAAGLVSQNLTIISDTGRENVRGANQLMTSSEELAQLAASLKKLVEHFHIGV
ncbi:HAMP domain-containing protein [Shewanella canadensis]|uniref:HAMP domain-containing protein n=1 Tax=Shewanella canadensis TaxID=271096 RepID=A0A431WUF3_9GAMM|nr:methyl-accepting chemotaxis protein [Shewanella canadensis]RTR39211.1 HAMP domain-containing protein [Shewanella canadensis]